VATPSDFSGGPVRPGIVLFASFDVTYCFPYNDRIYDPKIVQPAPGESRDHTRTPTIPAD